jgi:tetratricopeptide (TPR) repeat protein/tRNA A-37 threonylcarbamoyl transferase component Bud32
MQPQATPQSPLLGNRYRLEQPLGAGAMGVVYRAIDRLTQQTVALKRVTTHDQSMTTRLALAREFQTLASLRHPYIMSVLDYGFDSEQRPYFVMPLLDNAQDIKTAAKAVDGYGKVRLLIQLLQALSYLHRRGIVHRDLKPANVLVNQEGVVKVLDFGLAVEVEKAKEISGTLLYMAPEVLRMDGASPSSDLYAVGIIAFEMFTNVHPFDADDTAQLVQNIILKAVNVSQIEAENAALNPREVDALRAIVGRLTAKEPSERYHDAYDVMIALSHAIQHTAPTEDLAIRESFLQSARFVGRKAELAKLTDALEHTLNGMGSQWLVAGESGIGKTRLLDELRNVAMVRGALVLVGQEIAENGAPYQLWREPVRRMLLANPVHDLQASILREVVPDINDILGRPIPMITPLDAKDARQRLAVAIAELFLTSPKPTLLILEDVQWSNESLEPMRIISQQAHTPLMLVASYRTDEARDVAQLFPQMRSIQLERLTAPDIQELTKSMLGTRNANANVVDLLERETEGNVFFLVETVRALAEDAGSLDDVGNMTLPYHVFAGGVEQVVRRRLSRVPERYRAMLNLAAVHGRNLDLHILQTAAPQESVEDWLTVCANVDVVTNWNGTWRFSHDKLREALLKDLEGEERAALHGVIARAIEATYPNNTAYAHALADHWRVAGDTAKEAHYALIAGEVVLGVAGFKEALDLFQRAIRGLDNPREAVRLHRNIGDTYEGLSQYAEAIQHYELSRTLAEKYQDALGVAAAYDGIGGVEEKRGDLDRAEAHLTQALEIARDALDMRLVADTLNGIGTLYAKRGNLKEAQNYYSESLAIRRKLGDKRGIAATLNNLGVIQNFLGNHAQAKAYYEEALALRRDIDDKRGIAATLSNIGIVVKTIENHKAARVYYDEAIQIFRKIGDLHGVATLLNNLGALLLEQREFEDALGIYQECLRIVRAIGDERSAGYALHNIGRIYLAQNDTNAAQARFEEALAILTPIGDKRGIADVTKDSGIALMLEGAPSAPARLHDALTLWREVGDRVGVTQTLKALSQWHGTQGDHAQALTLARQAYDEARQAPILQQHHVLALLANIATFMGESTKAAQALGFLGAQNVTNPNLRHELKQLDARVRANLSVSDYAQALHNGTRMTLEDIFGAFFEA